MYDWYLLHNITKPIVQCIRSFRSLVRICLVICQVIHLQMSTIPLARVLAMYWFWSVFVFGNLAESCGKVMLSQASVLSQKGWEVTSNGSWDRSNDRVPPSPLFLPSDIRPSTLPPCYWHLVVITGDLFKLVHWGPRNSIWWWQLKLKPVWFPSGQYASYWNAILFVIVIVLVNNFQLISLNICERLSVMHKQVSVWTVNFFPNSPENPSLEFQIRVPPPPPPQWRLQISVDQVWIRVPPLKWRLQIWVDQSSDQSTPPPNEDFRFELTKVQIRVLPPPSKNEDFRFEVTKVQIRVPPPPPNEDFRFELTKVQIRVPPHAPPLLLFLVGVSVCGDLYLSYG